jgi:hypothetical protein
VNLFKANGKQIDVSENAAASTIRSNKLNIIIFTDDVGSRFH